MLQVRMWPLVGLSILTQGVLLPATSANAQQTEASVYLCQFGDTTQAYAFQTSAKGQLEGIGPLQGWTAVVQKGGLVARNEDQLLVIGDGPDSLVQGGKIVQGDCTDAAGDLAQVFENGGLATTPDTTESAPRTDTKTERAQPDPQEFASDAQIAGSDDMLAGMLAILDPQAWDSAKVAAIVDILSLDPSAKNDLKSALRSAGSDPVRIGAIARQIQRAISSEVENAAQLKARLQDARRELEATNRALDEQRQRVERLTGQLTSAEARATAAERQQSKTVALLGAAQRGLQEKVAELNRANRNLAALRNELQATQQQGLALQDALTAAAEQQQNATLQIETLTEQLVDMRARLARANNRIDELRAAKN
ncbi:MAG: hypothetical protein H7245_22310 [Candidatus Saccharibacteria bacterium]|nr:hypothetical protein [Pseudorhodobacter sp.]